MQYFITLQGVLNKQKKKMNFIMGINKGKGLKLKMVKIICAVIVFLSINYYIEMDLRYS